MAVTPNSIITPQAIKSNTAALTTANTNYTAPTNTAKIVTAGVNGARVTKLIFRPIATVTATECQEYRSADAGTTKRFSNSATMAAHTKSQTAQAPATDMGYSDLAPKLLGPTEELYVAIGVTGSVIVEAEWQDY